MFLYADSEDSDQTGWMPRSDRVDAQADLCLPLAYRSFCWFCHAVAQMAIRALKMLPEQRQTPKKKTVILFIEPEPELVPNAFERSLENNLFTGLS